MQEIFYESVGANSAGTVGMVVRGSYRESCKRDFFSAQQDKLNIVSLEEDDQVYILDGVSAKIFPKLINGESLDQLEKYISQIEGAPSQSEIQQFLKQFIADLEGLKIILPHK